MNISDRGIMIDGLGEGAVNDTKLFGYLGGVREEFADPDSLIVVVMFIKQSVSLTLTGGRTTIISPVFIS